MTHTLHRRGSPESLSHDFPVLCMVAMGINNVGSKPALQEFFRIANRHNPANMGSVTANVIRTPLDDVIANAHNLSQAVFTSKEDVIATLKDLKDADLGISIIVSGLVDVVDECCHAAGLKRHTVEFSLGIWGKTELLPADDVLEVTTMCGHGMVSPRLVESVVADVRAGKVTAQAAGRSLASRCTCGVFNPVRAAELIAAMAAK